MRTSEEGLALIRAFEGFRTSPYRCSAGVWTIGYGHTRGVTPDMPPISKAQAVIFLQQDVRVCEASITRLIHVALQQGQYDALVSFVFNLGAGALQRSTLRQKLNRGDVEGAGEEFSKWVFAAGKKLPGLVRRRAAEQQLFMRKP